MARYTLTILAAVGGQDWLNPMLQLEDPDIPFLKKSSADGSGVGSLPFGKIDF